MQQGSFSNHPTVSGVNFSNNTSVPQVRVKIIENDTTFEISKLLKPLEEKLSQFYSTVTTQGLIFK